MKRIDAVFAIEREINGQPAEARLSPRQQRIVPLINELENLGCGASVPGLSRHADVAKAFDYMLTRWPALDRLPARRPDHRLPTTPPNEPCAVSRSAAKAARLFAGSDRGGERPAVIYSLIATAELTSTLRPGWPTSWRVSPAIPISRLGELVPWNWRKHHRSLRRGCLEACPHSRKCTGSVRCRRRRAFPPRAIGPLSWRITSWLGSLSRSSP